MSRLDGRWSASRIATVVAIGATALAVQSPLGAATTTEAMADPLESDTADVPEVLKGDTWLRHHREDLMPYWDIPQALGDPVGNFPSFRDRAGQLVLDPPERTNRGLSTLARQVYGYSVAFMLTGEERYLTYAKAGLDWINTKAKDPVNGGYFGELKADGTPANAQGNKDVFDLASLGLAYGMYFNVTRDPAAEQDLLAVRDLLFDKYVVPGTPYRIKDSLTYDLATEVDTGGNGGDITNYLVPVTAMYLSNTALLTDPARRAQFRNDIRLLTQALIDRHKNPPTSANPWWFWGRTLRFGNFNALQTDFGHNIKSYEMIYNADQMFPDHPWASLSTDRTTLLNRAWDEAASRWNQRIRNFQLGNVEPDSSWWMHDEADQTLAALDLNDGFTNLDRLARSAQTWLDVYVDHDPAYPVRETFFRVSRNPEDTDLGKSGFGKNMLHAHEHALIMYLHGRELEGKPAKLYYAFPANQALTAVAKPYWFDASGEFREVTGNLSVLPGHKVVEVSFTGIGDVPDAPYPTPNDTTAPATIATVSPAPTAAGWNRDDVTVSFQAADDNTKVGVKEIHVRLEDDIAAIRPVAYIDPGDTFTLPSLTAEGEYDITYAAVDALGNTEEPQTLQVRLDLTDPVVDTTVVPAAPDGSNGWYVSPAALAYSCTDATSGIASCAPNASVGEGAAQVVSATGIDRAGNTRTVSSGPYDVDLTDPVVTCQSEPAFVLGQTGQVSATVADAGSGPAAPLVTAEADTSSVGSAAAPVTGADVAGRTAPASCGYQVLYGFTGFQAPVDNGVVNVAKAGTAIPLKWRLTDHAGNPVLDLAEVRITSAGHTCDGGAPEDAIEEVASGASGLQNLGDGNYQINWKSPKTYAGTCRTVQLDLGEGQMRTAEFRFKA
jgi:N-acylglucosamine 2-epimerase